MGPGPDGVQLQPHRRPRRRGRGRAVPFRGQADVPAPRAARDVHVPPGAAELLLLGMAPARVAAVPAGRAQRVRQRGRLPVRDRPAVRGRADRARDADDRVRHAHRERLQAVPALLLRPRPGDLGAGEPRRPDPGPGRARRREQPRGEPDGRACRQPVPLHGGQHRRRARRHPAQAGPAAAGRGGPLRRGGADAADVPGGRRRGAGARTPSSARPSATRWSTTCSR